MEFKLLEKHPNLKYGLSVKADGSMKISADQSTNKNRATFFGSLGFPAIVSAKIIHSSQTSIVSLTDSDKIIPGADGLVTSDENLLLTVTVADCFPVYFFDPNKKVIGLAHAGWKGILSGIVTNTLKAIMADFKSISDDILVAVGPGIQKHHFEIQKDVMDKFRQYSEFVKQSDKIRVDLSGIIRRQILDFGVPSANIEASNECTFCSKEKYFSFRRDKPEIVETMVAYIGIRM